MGGQKFDTLRRAKIRVLYEFCKDLNILNNNARDHERVTKRRIFEYFGVEPRSSYNILEGRDPDYLDLDENDEDNEALRKGVQ